jgi:hypothetical protein
MTDRKPDPNGIPPKRPGGVFAPTPKRAAALARRRERQARVWELRKAGYPLSAIAKDVGATKATVWSDFRAVLAELRPPQQDIEAYRTLEYERLEELRARLWVRFVAETERPGGGDGHMVAQLARSLVQVSESTRRLVGADVPVVQRVDVTAAVTAIDVATGLKIAETYRLRHAEPTGLLPEHATPAIEAEVVDVVEPVRSSGTPAPDGGEAES